jgi:hypothetical protein
MKKAGFTPAFLLVRLFIRLNALKQGHFVTFFLAFKQQKNP